MHYATTSSSTKAVNAFLAIMVLSFLVAGCAPTTDTTDDTSSLPEQTDAPADTDETSDADDEQEYADGTYSATGDYTSPAGAEQVDVTLTLEDGVITDAQFVGKAFRPISQKMQGQFSQGYTEVVVGKPIDELSLTVVNGSSLAPKGFMNAVEKIKVQAQAA